MLAHLSSRGKPALAAGWLVFASINAWLMYALPGEETIPYHLIWASYAFVYGLVRWSAAATAVTFTGVTVVTGIPLVSHARAGYIGWEECSEIVLMALLVAMVIWHVRRSQVAHLRLTEQMTAERTRAHQRDLAARSGSHELRTRLTIARGFVELVRRGSAESTVREDATVAIEEIEKATKTTDDLLTLVRLDAPPEITSVDVAGVVAGVARRWQIREDRTWTFRAEPITTAGDPARLEAALDCLVENAVKFTERGDAISVTASRSGHEIVIAVSDTGVGIPPDDVDRVADVFTTSPSAGDRAGSGLGLSIVRAIAEARGGSLAITSRLGEGTVVAIRTPVSPRPTVIPRLDVRGSSPGAPRPFATESQPHVSSGSPPA